MPFFKLPTMSPCSVSQLVARIMPHQDHTGTEICGDAVFVESDRDDGGWLVLLIDVMGHGLKAHQVAEWIGDIVLRDSRVQRLAAAEFVRRLDNWLAPVFAETARFACALAVSGNHQGSLVQLVNAGMPTPLIGSPTGWSECDAQPGRMLGLPELGGEHRPCPLSVNPGEVLLLHSDGLSDAAHQFGRHADAPRLTDILPVLAHDNADSLVADIIEIVKDAAGEHWLEDDTTVATIVSAT